MPEPSNSPAPALVFQIGDFKTLPLYFASGVLLEELRSFDHARFQVSCKNPEYENVLFDLSPEWLTRISTDSATAISVVNKFNKHFFDYMYYIQFRDDTSRQKVRALHDHTALISALCDARLGIDTTELWTSFDNAQLFEMIHSQYREDANREATYQQYADRLAKANERYGRQLTSATRLLERIVRQIEWKKPVWSKLPPICHAEQAGDSPISEDQRKIRVFFSYSHKDEALRDQLETHLAVLRRKGVIENWHDRKIGAGNEWKNEIDDNMEASNVILLLISADFLNSDYCYDVEMRRALERHDQGGAKVIPVLLRACDWMDSPFSKLQVLPTDAKAVTSWLNSDEAFTDIAKGIRKEITALATLSKS